MQSRLGALLQTLPRPPDPTRRARNDMVDVIDGFRWGILGGQSRLFLPGKHWGSRFFLAGHPPISEDGKELRRLDLNSCHRTKFHV
jgi:hypothetical protein